MVLGPGSRVLAANRIEISVPENFHPRQSLTAETSTPVWGPSQASNVEHFINHQSALPPVTALPIINTIDRSTSRNRPSRTPIESLLALTRALLAFYGHPSPSRITPGMRSLIQIPRFILTRIPVESKESHRLEVSKLLFMGSCSANGTGLAHGAICESGQRTSELQRPSQKPISHPILESPYCENGIWAIRG